VSLIQAGGLGYMTLSTLLAAVVRKRLSLQERVILQESFNLDSREGIARFAWTVARTTLGFELAGMVVLSLYWTPAFGFGRATYLAGFHAVSAFNNAGFSLFPDNLMRFRGDVVVNLVITALIISGGLGFLVLKEIGTWILAPDRFRSFARMSVHTRLVLSVTGLLVAAGTGTLFVLERSNPRTLAEMPAGEALLAAYFQAVSPRTAGFNTITIGDMLPVSLFVMMVLMFIGASPGSTGGGIKTTTFGVTVAALWATIRGERDPVLLKRRLPPETVARAFFICLIAFLALNAVAALLLVSENRELLPTLFETTSAFGTVGLSMGHQGSVVSLAGHFTSTGKLLLAAMMFMGRVGPLTLAIAVVGRLKTSRIRYPEARVMIG
jgi:trk system potassium uptake protein TrkH